METMYFVSYAKLQVIVAAVVKRNHVLPSNPQLLHAGQSNVNDSNNDGSSLSPHSGDLFHTERFRYISSCPRYIFYSFDFPILLF